jgi:hypothetical protein
LPELPIIMPQKRDSRAGAHSKSGGGITQDPWRIPRIGSVTRGLFMTRRLAQIARNIVVASLFVVPAAKSLAANPTVNTGYDLLQTDPTATTFPGLGNMMGVPFVTYDFGGSVGAALTGYTDTIVQRVVNSTPPAVPGTAPTIADQIDALQLETVAPVDFEGLGLNNYFLTLQSDHGGPFSTGSMTIFFADVNGGTFDSSLDIFYDIRQGALDGPIVASSSAIITGSNTPWSRTAPTGADLIDSINNNLDGSNDAQDFWPANPITESGGGFTDTLNEAILPEPSSATGLLFIAAPFLLRRRRMAIL